jgi:hypothetical protein
MIADEKINSALKETTATDCKICKTGLVLVFQDSAPSNPLVEDS